MIRKRRHSLQKQLQLNKGFTLVELLVVIAIMAIVIGGSAIGVSVISRGNVKKAGNFVYTEINNLRSQTLTVNADWKLDIVKDTDGTCSKTIGKGYNITISDYANSSDKTDYAVDSDKKATVTYTRSSGRVGSFVVNAGASRSDKLDVNNNLKAVITISRGSHSYDVTVWYSTGKLSLS